MLLDQLGCPHAIYICAGHLSLCTGAALHLQADDKKKKWEPPVPPPRVGKKQKKRGAAAGLGTKLPNVTPNAKCKLRLLKLERVKDWLLMEEEFVANQERLKPQEERNEEDRSKVRMAHHICVCRLCLGVPGLSLLHRLTTSEVLP